MVKLDLEKAEVQRSNCQHLLDHRKSGRVPEKHLLLLYWLRQAFDCVDYDELWKIIKEMGIQDHLSCLLRSLHAVQEATVRTGHGTTDWFQMGKGVRQGCILSPCLLNLYAEYIMRNARLDDIQARIKIAGSPVSQECHGRAGWFIIKRLAGNTIYKKENKKNLLVALGIL